MGVAFLDSEEVARFPHTGNAVQGGFHFVKLKEAAVIRTVEGIGNGDAGMKGGPPHFF